MIIWERADRVRAGSRRMATFALGALTLLGLAACSSGGRIAGHAQALPSSPDVTSLRLQGVASVDLRKKFDESPQEINKYWTRDRLRKAQPLDPGNQIGNPTPGTSSSSTPSPSGTPSAPSPGTTAPTTQPSTPRPRTSATRSHAPAPPPPRDPGTSSFRPPTRGRPAVGATLPNNAKGSRFGKPGLTKSTAGRLYFVMNHQNWVCSGTVVNSPSKNIVASAGHCVWDTETGTGWGHDYLFIPDDANNGAEHPYGRWTANRVYTTQIFTKQATGTKTSTSGAGWAYDTSFLRMAKLNGRKIQSVTGGQGIAFGAPVSSVMQIGYPAAPPFSGKFERFCTSSTWTTGQYGDRGHPCRMTGGSSGGGWLTDFNQRTGAGYLIGTTSIGNGSYMWAAQMGATALNTFNLAVSGK
jgi:hypothetical protein